jgi:tetratricopeptide (TPR) repeat protein
MEKPAALLYADAMSAMSRGALDEGTRGIESALAAGLRMGLVPDAHANLGTAFSMLGRNDEAAVQYILSLRLRPGSSMAHYNLGILSADRGRTGEAEAHYRRALSLGRFGGQTLSLGEVYNNLGNLLVGRRAEQMAAFEASIALAPTHALAYNNYGNMLKAEADDDAAALAATPTTARAARARHTVAAAVRHYRMAMVLRPAYPAAYTNLGSVLKERHTTRMPRDRLEPTTGSSAPIVRHT